MDESLACSDFCEENGFTRQAELLRSLTGPNRKAFVILGRGAEYNDEIMNPHTAGEPRAVHLDRVEAEKVAANLNAEWYRENNILDHCYRLEDVTSFTKVELEAKIGSILGRDFELPNGGDPTYAYPEGGPIFEPATGEQMRQIADLFALEWYYVVETEFAPADRS